MYSYFCHCQILINKYLSPSITQQALSEEAQLCIQDVLESLETDHFEEELQCAEMAVGNAGIAYSELLEELALTNEGVQLLNEVRKVVAPAIEALKEELRHIGKLKSKEGWRFVKECDWFAALKWPVGYIIMRLSEYVW